MSKRKRKSSKNFKEKHPREIGKFYHAYDKSGGHPSRIYDADPDKDKYFIQRFSTKKRKGRIKLKHSINPKSDNDEWLIKRPEIIGFDDMTFKDKYKDYRIHPDDEKTVEQYQTIKK